MNYYDRMLAVTPAIFRKPVVLAILSAVGSELDKAEAARSSMQLGVVLSTATGILLDRFGELYQVPRGSFSDADYRAVLQAFRVAHASNGERESLIRILKAVTGALQVITIEYWPVGVGYELDGASTDPERIRLMWLAVYRALNSGVSLVGIRANPAGTLYFGWRDDPNAAGFDEGTWREFL